MKTSPVEKVITLISSYIDPSSAEMAFIEKSLVPQTLNKGSFLLKMAQ